MLIMCLVAIEHLDHLIIKLYILLNDAILHFVYAKILSMN